MITTTLFGEHGTRFTLENVETGTKRHFKAFVQPLRYRNKIYLRGKFTEIGKNQEDYYLYLGPPEVDISAVDGVSVLLKTESDSFLVYRREKHLIGDDCYYIWAIIRPVIEEENDD